MLDRTTLHSAVARLFESKGWRPFDFQREVWARMAAGESGLLHATTGAGKTLAVALGAWQALREPPTGLTVLWVTPMRALAADTTRALSEALDALHVLDATAPRWTLGLRTGDTSSSQRAAQSRKPPTLLVTTPESLSLLLSRENARDYFAELRCVVVDEWHELLGNKRGVQTQLALARLRRFRPGLTTWGMSATLGDLDAAKRALLGPQGAGALIEARLKKKLVIDTLIPQAPERFPWAGHLGLKMAPQVVAEIEAHESTLLFTNTRAQAELWRQHLLRLRPEWAERVGIHHGSLAQEERDAVERALKAGALKAVVCTSSLDLGVDFLPVERVLQIGSPKGVARLLQRAGRSGHAPGRVSRVTLVPSHSLELVESAAAQAAIRKGRIESRSSPVAPLDVLAQHLVTVGLGGGFRPEELLAEVRETVAYETLSDENWRWCLDFVRQGGPTLRAYPDYRRAAPGPDGVWRVTDKRLALRHRLNIGAIVADASVLVQYGPAPRGQKLGTVEETFARAAQGDIDSPELCAARPLLRLQQKWSALPTPHSLLAETLKSREGWHLFLYPFAGRNAHLGLASLLAWRAAQIAPGAFSIAVNDYGFELLSGAARDWAADLPRLIEARGLEATRAEVVESLNAAELARRRFRDIAQIAGLVVNGYPGERKSVRQLQASSSLFYDVFRRYDPENGLLKQAERELLEDELDVRRLHEALVRLNARRLDCVALERCSPLAFPLVAERFRESLSTESFNARIERMLAQLNAAADK
ncbi:MAG: DEAD/DEAH box helicase [Methylocystis sp.]|uniref:DEAD/DEAH box helicase n=1 Tax=Methylocystis sp. TaxID=1911079 RepID=UPI003DA4094F